MNDGPAPQHPVLDAESVIAVLNDHHVAYVVVGGYAAELHGSARPTVDIDVVPATDADNLGRLAAALRDLGSRIRTDSDHHVGAVTVAVASLDDVIRSTTAAARVKDLRALPELRALAARAAQA